jgi:uncharacterized membrane protein
MATMVGTLVIALSAICMFLSAAPFTPAVFLSLILMCVGGIFGVFGRIHTSLAILFFCTLSVVASPVSDIGEINLCIILVPYVLGFAGVSWGVRKKHMHGAMP